jgi:hypothetical protein
VALASGYLNHYADFSKLLFFEADGTLRQEWRAGEYLGLGGVIAHKGRLFMLYTAASQSSPGTNRVLVRELQCVP